MVEDLKKTNDGIKTKWLVASIIDFLVVLIIGVLSVVVITHAKVRLFKVIGSMIMASSLFYIILKNVFFCSFGFISQGILFQLNPERQSRSGALKIRVLLSNLFSLSPISLLILLNQRAEIFSMFLLIWIVNNTMMFIMGNRPLDDILRISILLKNGHRL